MYCAFRGNPWHSSEARNFVALGSPRCQICSGVSHFCKPSVLATDCASRPVESDMKRVLTQYATCRRISGRGQFHQCSPCTTTLSSFRSNSSRQRHQRHAVRPMLQFTCSAAAAKSSDSHETLMDHHGILEAPSYDIRCNVIAQFTYLKK